MNKRQSRNRIVSKRILSAVMAAAFLCCFGCAKPEESSVTEDPNSDLPDKGYITLTAVEGESTKVSFELTNPEETEPLEAEKITATHVVNAQDVKLRTGSSTEYDKIAELNEGTGVVVYSSENGWHKVKTADGKVGFIRADFVSTTSGGISYGKVSARDVKLRKGPSTSHDIITELAKETELTIYAAENGWYKVKTTAGVEGYISADFVSDSSDAADGENEAEGTSEPTDKPKKTETPKSDEKAESTPKPTEKPKKKANTPYSKKYTKVKVNYVDSDPITFSTSTLSGDGVSQSMFAKNAITVVNIWTRT